MGNRLPLRMGEIWRGDATSGMRSLPKRGKDRPAIQIIAFTCLDYLLNRLLKRIHTVVGVRPLMAQ